MAHILGYARVSTGDQDVAGQAMRLKQAGVMKVFTERWLRVSALP
jgi:DNA invertase Pin-like site-specific DNA recombinase